MVRMVARPSGSPLGAFFALDWLEACRAAGMPGRRRYRLQGRSKGIKGPCERNAYAESIAFLTSFLEEFTRCIPLSNSGHCSGRCSAADQGETDGYGGP